jgi:tRNA1Val (adenine37-N6)-methyltransferase
MEQTELLGASGFRLTQRDGLFKLGQDSLLLANFTSLRPRERVCDLGCGVGVLPLLLLDREPSLSVTGVELCPEACALARHNLTDNGLAGTVLQGDVRNIPALMPAGQTDLLICNPPYFPAGAGGVAAGAKGLARSDGAFGLDDLCAAARWLLKNGGRMALCWRPERLCGLLSALRAAELEPKRLQLVQARPDKAPFLALVECRRQGGPGLEVLPVRICGQT